MTDEGESGIIYVSIEADNERFLRQIFEALGKKKNGHLAPALEELAEAGFIAADPGINPGTGKASNTVRYRIKDNYARFYLHYIEPFADMIGSGAFAFVSLGQFGGWKSMEGLAFENLVVNNFREFLGPLGLEKSLIVSASPFRKDSRTGGDGVPVDLMLQTALGVYFVENRPARATAGVGLCYRDQAPHVTVTARRKAALAASVASGEWRLWRRRRRRGGSKPCIRVRSSRG